MMGGFQSNSRPGQTGSAAAPWILAGVLLAGSAAAGSAGSAIEGAESPDARVSTSPEPSAAQDPPATGSSDLQNTPDASPPLTRAAARRQVETISPVPWLARFGPVSLERRE